MTDRELWRVIWEALRMVKSAMDLVDDAIAKKYLFGKYRETTQN